VIFVAASRDRVCTCVGAQTSTASSRTSAVAFIGSIAACARNGPRYTASSAFPRSFVDVAVNARNRGAAPARGLLAAANMVAVLTCAAGPSFFHVTTSASRPVIAAQVLLATTATPLLIFTTSENAGDLARCAVVEVATVPRTSEL